jgi:Na+/H+ antiporter NhaD/arsenite permease-like protein
VVRGPSSPPLSVEDAKARLRLAAARAEPAMMMERAISTSPWTAVALFLALGLVIGATPALRRSVAGIAATGLRGVTRR